MHADRRQPFDLDAPFAAREALVYGERRFAAGEVFPWRELGLSDLEVWNLWRTLHVDNVSVPPATIVPSGSMPTTAAPQGIPVPPPTKAERRAERRARS